MRGHAASLKCLEQLKFKMTRHLRAGSVAGHPVPGEVYGAFLAGCAHLYSTGLIHTVPGLFPHGRLIGIVFATK